MNLHKNKDAFRTIVQNISSKTEYRIDVLEKDYYVSLLLKELSIMQTNGLPAYFKGGTALYKILGNLKRFSEDIDISVNVSEMTNSQKRKILKRSAKGYSSMEYMKDSENEIHSVTSIYAYESMVSADTADQLQRFGVVKIEATSFTISEPVESHSIGSLIFTLADEMEQRILSEKFGVNAFEILTISLERMFIDKIYAIESYIRKERFFDVAKHVFDVYNLFQLQRIKDFLLNPKEVGNIIQIQRREEICRFGGISSDKSISDFTLFSFIQSNKKFHAVFFEMQKVYVFNNDDILETDGVVFVFNQLFEIFSALFIGD